MFVSLLFALAVYAMPVVRPGRTLDIPTPRAYVPLLAPARYKGVHGGRGSAKSHFFAELLVETAFLGHTRAVCIREVQRSLAQSAKKLIEDKIQYHKLERSVKQPKGFKITNSHIECPHEGLIIFEGMQNHTADSIKSLEGFNRAWVEEAQSLSQRSIDLLRPTIRMPDSEIWLSWNPRKETDPVEKLLRPKDGVAPPGSLVIGTTYKDNPFFPQVLRDEMEWDRARDVEKYEHIWLGDYEKHAEARVFKNWTIEEFDTPSDALFYYGADWGFSADPATLVRCFVRGRKLCIDYEAYKIGVEIDYLPAHFDQVPGSREWTIRADSARPETISYMNRHGYPKMLAATKGPNSVKEGIIFLQGYDIIVHPRCVHTITELKAYSYVRDKLTNEVTPILKDDENHIIDPLRYAVETLRQPKRELTW